MGIFSRKATEEREALERQRVADEAERDRIAQENANPALQYFVKLVIENMNLDYARNMKYYSLSYGRSPIPNKVRERYGDEAYMQGVNHEAVMRLLNEQQEGLRCERSPNPSGGWWIYFPEKS